jgi:hypothetical protein
MSSEMQIPPSGPWTPNDLANLAKVLPRGLNLAKSFIAALMRKDLSGAQTLLRTLHTVFETVTPENARLLARFVLSELPKCRRVLQAAGLLADFEVVLQGAVALASSALTVVLLFIFITAALMSHPQQAMAQERRSSSNGRDQSPDGGAGSNTHGNEWVKELRELLAQLGTANPVNHAKKVAAGLRKKDLCICSKQHRPAPLGSNFVGQQLAFQSVPGISGPGTLHTRGGAGGASGSSPRGRPNPFELPQRGGSPLPPPGSKGKPGDTLPGKPPPGQCLWPLCQELQHGAG